MSIVRLHLVFLSVMFCSVAAFAGDPPPKTWNFKLPTKTDSSNTDINGMRISLYRLPANFRVVKRENVQRSPDLSLGDTCYTMRTYVEKRDDPDSDSTHRVSYTTCQPGPRFQVRQTVMQDKPTVVQW